MVVLLVPDLPAVYRGLSGVDSALFVGFGLYSLFLFLALSLLRRRLRGFFLFLPLDYRRNLTG